MSGVYNPETHWFERLEAMELEARQLVHKRAGASHDEQRDMLTRQLKELEQRIEAIKRRLKR
jgi:hypothetical protein